MKPAWQPNADPYSVGLRLDRDAVRRLASIKDRLHFSGLDDSLAQPSTKPRVILTRFARPPEVNVVADVLEQLARSWEPFLVTFADIVIEPGLSPKVWLGCSGTSGIREHHRQLHAAAATWPHHYDFEVDTWEPRLLLSDRVTSMADAVQAIVPILCEPITGSAVAVQLVDDASGAVIWNGELNQRLSTGRQERTMLAEIFRRPIQN